MTDGETPLESLGVPIPVAKQQLRDDPNTATIAKALGVDIETYIDKVLYYAQRPEEDAQVTVLSPGEIADLGGSVPSPAVVNQWFEAVEKGEISLTPVTGTHHATEYSAAPEAHEVVRRAAGVQVSKAAPKVDAPKGEITGAGAALKQQLLAQRQGVHLRRDQRPTKKK